uniref:Protein root UVB sensitive/RUS domain-containing protein n=1 Tax=Chenopodium quinoa TaxID=63459 RepID=A0A803MCN3_CHEQI
MLSSTKIPSNLRSFQFSWNPSLPRNFYPQFLNANPTTPFKTFSLSSTFKTTTPNSDSQQPFIKKHQFFSKIGLPVIIRKNGRNYKYFWDEGFLELVCVDDGDPLTFVQSFEVGIRNFVKILRDFFIPKLVTENYIEYVKWKFLHRVFSSSLQVLATQAMFRAIGVGYAQSLPSAAAMNWVLKDGLGRLSRCIYTACVGSAFDTNLKRVRFATSVMFSLSIGVELMTPAFPNCFLLLASVANIAKQISLACYLATGTAVHRSFALADNLGEVSAKAQIQTVCFDNLGLLLAALINVMLKNNERLELILDKWIQCGYVPSPAEVSKLEGINLLEAGRKKGDWPIRIGCLDPKRQIPGLTMLTMNSLSREDFYFICLETCYGLRSGKQGILLSLREGARTEDIIMGLLQPQPKALELDQIHQKTSNGSYILQACYIRQTLLSCSSKWKNVIEDFHISNSHIMKWLELSQDSKSFAQSNLNTLHKQMLDLSWATKNILLGTHEQARYVFDDK